MSTPPEIPESMYNCNSDAPDYAEGVAAPLEPTQMLDEMVRDFCSLAKAKVKSEVRRRIEAYAAAVSKNLQEELADLKRGDNPYLAAAYGMAWKDMDALRSKIVGLEKEIAALRLRFNHLD